MYLDVQSMREEYQFSKRAGNFDRSLARLMAEERNAWISGSALGLWIILHRYRNLLKKYHRLLDGIESLKMDKLVCIEEDPETRTKTFPLENKKTV